MNIVRLPPIWIERLVRLPESGMGYQRVNIHLKRGKVLSNVIVVNAEECQAPEPFDPADIEDVKPAV